MTAILVVSVLAMLTAVASAEQLYVNENGWYRAGGGFNASETPIQHAIDNATEGDSIYVCNGSYTENVDVNKAHLTLQGEGRDVVTVTAQSAGDHVFEVTEDYVNISGFTATGATNGGAGIYLNSSVDNCSISDNTANSNGGSGIYLACSSSNNLTSNTANSNGFCGIFLLSSSNNPLTNNTASNNCYGIYLACSSSNNLTSNTANSNGFCGIYLYDADDNNITCNWVAHNDQRGFYLFDGSTGNNISNNSIMSNGELQADGSYHWNFYNHQTDDVEAKHNYWGAGMDNDTINASIYDWQDDPSNCGNVTFLPKLTGPDPCAPIPELPTVLLFAVGLLMLAGYVRVGRRK